MNTVNNTVRAAAKVVNDTMYNYRHAAAAQGYATQCAAYVSALQQARYRIDADGHLILTFGSPDADEDDPDDNALVYAEQAEEAAAAVASLYNILSHANLYLNTDGHLIAAYPRG